MPPSTLNALARAEVFRCPRCGALEAGTFRYSESIPTCLGGEHVGMPETVTVVAIDDVMVGTLMDIIVPEMAHATNGTVGAMRQRIDAALRGDE